MKQTQGRFLLQPNKDFPADCELLDHLQTNAHIVSIIGNLAGDKAVLLGCEPNTAGSQRAAGYVFLRTREHPEGEVLYWEGGAASGSMYLRRESIGVQAQGYDYPQAYEQRSLAPGVGEESYRWADFRDARTLPQLAQEIDDLRKELAAAQSRPLGIVETWAGTTVPTDYALCDGRSLWQAGYPELYKAIGTRYNNASNADGTQMYFTQPGYFRLPDLRGRFIVGHYDTDSDYNTYGKAGGEKRHQLSINEMPSHCHRQNLWKEGDGHWRSGGNNSSPHSVSWHNSTTPYGNTDYTGGGNSHENRPPYYTLAYIMRLR